MSRFTDKIALVTGANSGLGLGAAQQLVREGATVYIAGRRADKLDEAAASMGEHAVPVVCDVTVQDDLDEMFATITERSGRLDAVVANAGVATYGSMGAYTREHVDTTLDVNLKGVLFTVQGALPLLPDGASVVIMSSVEGLRGSEGLGMYAATKAALQSFARTWANDLKDRRIRVNAISPGFVYTPAYALNGMSISDMDPVLPSIPAGRLGEIDEIATAIAFLASDDASFVNAANLVVDGGQTGIV